MYFWNIGFPSSLFSSTYRRNFNDYLRPSRILRIFWGLLFFLGIFVWRHRYFNNGNYRGYWSKKRWHVSLGYRTDNSWTHRRWTWRITSCIRRNNSTYHLSNEKNLDPIVFSNLFLQIN